MTSLFIDAISKRYERGRWALRDVSLRQEAGVLGLVGPNGAGKTTLLRMLATLLAPTSGLIAWNGQDIARHPHVLRRVLGYVPQEFGVYPQLTAREFLRYIGELKGLRGQLLHRRVASVLETVRLAEDADRRLRSFSGGMIRRVGIAQSLLNEPRLLVLDEPTAGLDPAERMRFRETLAALQGSCMVIVSTHIISDVEAIATDIALLQRGRLLWTGATPALLADAAGTTWSLTTDPSEFERLRGNHPISTVMRRGERVELRLLAHTQPHPQAVSVAPTLEEAYLHFVEQEGGEAVTI